MPGIATPAAAAAAAAASAVGGMAAWGGTPCTCCTGNCSSRKAGSQERASATEASAWVLQHMWPEEWSCVRLLVAPGSLKLRPTAG
jgi:hypothetical protein